MREGTETRIGLAGWLAGSLAGWMDGQRPHWSIPVLNEFCEHARSLARFEKSCQPTREVRAGDGTMIPPRSRGWSLDGTDHHEVTTTTTTTCPPGASQSIIFQGDRKKNGLLHSIWNDTL